MGGFSLSQRALDITRNNFFGKDFDTYIQEIRDALIAEFGADTANNFIASDTGVMLYDMTSFALSTLSWYGDRQAGETNLDPIQGAILRANAVAIARMLGYKPSDALPAEATLSVTLNAAPGPTVTRLTIPKGSALNGPGGLTFETTSELIFDGVAGPLTVVAQEGSTFEEVFTSDGTIGQRFRLGGIPDTKSLANGSVKVTVNGVLWTTVTFLTYDATNQVEVESGRDKPFVRFGDGIAGNIPPDGAEIRVEYFITGGTAGAVTSDTITSFVEPLVAGTTTYTATITHPTSTAGNDRESIASIKLNAPKVFSAAQRAVTVQDLDGLINSYPGVAIGHATVPRSAAASASLQTHLAQLAASGISQDVIDAITADWNKVVSSSCQANIVEAQILAADTVGRYVSASVTVAQGLETYLDGLVESTVKVLAVDGTANVLSVDMSVNLKTVDTLTNPIDREAVRSTVLTTTQNQLLNRAYGVSLRFSDLYALLEAITGVAYVEISITNLSTRANSFGLAIEDYEVITMGAIPTVTLI